MKTSPILLLIRTISDASCPDELCQRALRDLDFGRGAWVGDNKEEVEKAGTSVIGTILATKNQGFIEKALVAGNLCAPKAWLHAMLLLLDENPELAGRVLDSERPRGVLMEKVEVSQRNSTEKQKMQVGARLAQVMARRRGMPGDFWLGLQKAVREDAGVEADDAWREIGTCAMGEAASWGNLDAIQALKPTISPTLRMVDKAIIGGHYRVARQVFSSWRFELGETVPSTEDERKLIQMVSSLSMKVTSTPRKGMAPMAEVKKAATGRLIGEMSAVPHTKDMLVISRKIAAGLADIVPEDAWWAGKPGPACAEELARLCWNGSDALFEKRLAEFEPGHDNISEHSSIPHIFACAKPPGMKWGEAGTRQALARWLRMEDAEVVPAQMMDEYFLTSMGSECKSAVLQARMERDMAPQQAVARPRL